MKTKIHNKQVVSEARDVTLPHIYIKVEFLNESYWFFQPTSDNAQFTRPVIVNRFPTPDTEQAQHVRLVVASKQSCIIPTSTLLKSSKSGLRHKIPLSFERSHWKFSARHAFCAQVAAEVLLPNRRYWKFNEALHEGLLAKKALNKFTKKQNQAAPGPAQLVTRSTVPCQCKYVATNTAGCCRVRTMKVSLTRFALHLNKAKTTKDLRKLFLSNWKTSIDVWWNW